MTGKIHYQYCPVCNSAAIHPVLEVKDYTVTGEVFDLYECADCSLRFTQDIPDRDHVAPYYKAESYISHTNTSKGFINRLYHFVRKKTIVKKRRLVERATGLKKGNILDVGSGIGSFIHEMKQHGWAVTGIEPDADARKVARDTYSFELEEANRFYQLPANHFDAITLWHVLEHVHDLAEYIQQLKSVLKEKGKIFIAVPNYTSGDATVYRQYWAAYDVPRHLYHFSPRSMEKLMKQNGLAIVAYKPMWYDSFYISLLSSKYKNQKTNWIAAFFNGFQSNFSALLDKKKCSSVIYVIEKRS